MARSIAFLVLLAWVALSLAPAEAATYRWVDANGVVHYSDRPPPETAPAPDTPAAVTPPAAKPKTSEAPAPLPAAPSKPPVASAKPAPSVAPAPPAAVPPKAATAGSIPAAQVAVALPGKGQIPAQAEGAGLLDILQSIFGLVVIATSIWVFIDARKIGVRKGLVTGMANLSPVGWLVASLLIWVVAFPLYLAKRGTLRTRAAA